MTVRKPMETTAVIPARGGSERGDKGLSSGIILDRESGRPSKAVDVTGDMGEGRIEDKSEIPDRER